MKIQTEPQLRNASATNFSAGRSLLLQRQCACGGSAGISGKCEACRQKRMTLPLRARNDERLHAAGGNIRNITLNAAVFAAAGRELKR